MIKFAFETNRDMAFFNFNKIPDYRTFNYVPRYYDPAKEERDAIVRRAKIEAGLIEDEDFDQDVERAKGRISSSFRSRGISNQYKRTSHKKSNIRIVIIVIILAAISYIILNFNIDLLVRAFE